MGFIARKLVYTHNRDTTVKIKH